MSPEGQLLFSGKVTAALRVQMWNHWASVAIESESRAALGRFEILTSTDNKSIDYVPELKAAIVSIAASAHCLDSFYGLHRSVVPEPIRVSWRKKKTPRPRQILETLKVAFGVPTEKWISDFDWLFDLRDAALHHDAAFHPPALHPAGGNTAREYVDYSIESVSRAINLMLDMLDACANGKKTPKDLKEVLVSDVQKLRLERKKGGLALLAELATRLHRSDLM
jgi:hypothetical protein